MFQVLVVRRLGFAWITITETDGTAGDYGVPQELFGLGQTKVARKFRVIGRQGFNRT